MAIPIQPGLFGERLVLGDLESRILALCRRDPDLANSDRGLALAIWAEEGLDDAISGGLERFGQWWMEEATGFESISRAARKLRAGGLLKVSPAVAQARRQLAEEHRQMWGTRHGP